MYSIYLSCVVIVLATTMSSSAGKDIFNQRVTIDMLEIMGGSIYGGARLYIRGTGFRREDVEGVTTVLVGSNQCEIIEYYSHDTQLVCIVPPSSTLSSRRATVSVYVQTVEKVQQAECRYYRGCYFDYRSDRTPVVYSTQYSAPALHPWSFYGRLRASDPDTYEVMIGNEFCTVEEDINQNPMGESYRDTRGRCVTPGLEAGYYNFSMRASEMSYTRDLGFAELQHNSYHAAFDVDPEFNILLHPVVDGVSTRYLGQEGGHEIRIRGHGFSSNATSNTVHLAGSPCKVLSAMEDEIRCEAGPAMNRWGFGDIESFNASEWDPQDTLYPGGRGLTAEAWYMYPSVTSLDDEFAAANTPFYSAIQTDTLESVFEYVFNSENKDRFCQRHRGFFLPPISANYSFYLAGDDYGSLSISPNETKEHAQLVAYHYSYSPEFYDRDSQRSSPIYFESGKRYFTEIRHCENYGGEFMRVAVRIHSQEAGNQAQRAHNTLPERQVLSIETDVQYETQTLEVRALEGQYRLRVGSTLAAENLAFDAHQNDVRDAVRDIIDCNSIGVSSSSLQADQDHPTPGTLYTISIRCPRPLTAQTWPLISALNLGLKGVNGTDAAPVIERTVLPSEPVSGTFRVGFQGDWTPMMDYDIRAWQLRNYLYDSTNITQLEYSDSGNPGFGRSHTLTFITPRGNVPTLEVDASGLSGENVRIAVTTVEEGSLDHFYDPIPADFFMTADPEPQIEVWTNGIKASCSQPYNGTEIGCSFVYAPEETPLVHAVSLSAVEPGSTLVIEGERLAAPDWEFDALGRNISEVLFNGTNACNVTHVDDERIECTMLDVLPAGMYNVVVNVPGRGHSLSASSAPVEFTSGVTAVAPIEGSNEGGTPVMVQGWGFNPDHVGRSDIIMVGNAGCEIKEATTTSLTCYSPSLEDAADARRLSMVMSRELASTDVNETITLHGDTEVGVFFYKESATPWAMDSSLEQGSVAATHTMVFHGDFGDDPIARAHSVASELSLQQPVLHDIVRVHFTEWGKSCVPVSLNSTTLVCRLVRSPALPVEKLNSLSNPLIWLFPVGYVSLAGDLSLKLDGSTTAISGGSSFRGANITITGSGFLPLPSSEYSYTQLHESEGGEDLISFLPMVEFIAVPSGEKYDCEVLSATYTSIECALAPAVSLNDEMPGSDILLHANVSLNGIVLTQACGNPSNNCTHMLKSDDTPAISGVAMESNSSVLVVHGSLLQAVSQDNADTRVYVGGHLCPVMSATSSQVKCTLPHQQFGTAIVGVFVEGYGRAVGNFSVAFPLEVTAVEHAEGSAAGGFRMRISGRGFSPNWREHFLYAGNARGSVIESSTTELTVLAPSLSSLPSSIRKETLQLLVKPADFMDAGPRVRRVGGAGGPEDDSLWWSITPASTAKFLPPVSDEITYSRDLTPSLTSVSPESGYAGDTLTLVGEGLVHPDADMPVPSNYTATMVYVGGVECAVNISALTDTSLICVLGGTPAGSQPVEVFIDGIGRAWGSGHPIENMGVRFNSLLEVTGASPVDTSGSVLPKVGLGGGATVRLRGRGFPSLHAPDDWWHRAYFSTVITGEEEDPLVSVDVCGMHCTTSASDYTSVDCTSPAMNTPQLQRTYGHLPEDVLQGVAFGNGGGDVEAAFDGSITTAYKSNWGSRSSCHVGIDLGIGARAGLTSIRIFAPFEDANIIKGFTFEGSINGDTWHEVGVAGPRVQSDWNTVTVNAAYHFDNASAPLFRFLRFSGTSNSYCEAHEVEFIGYRFLAANALEEGAVRFVDNGDSIQRCNVSVSLYRSRSSESRRLQEAFEEEDTPEVAGEDTELLTPGREWSVEEAVADGSVPLGARLLEATATAARIGHRFARRAGPAGAVRFFTQSPYESLTLARHATPRIDDSTHRQHAAAQVPPQRRRSLVSDSGTLQPIDLSSEHTVDFTENLTPYVEEVSPRNGTARGGDVVTLLGHGFSQDLSKNKVYLNGIPCEPVSVSGDSSELSCTTGPRVSINPISTRVFVEGKGNALVDRLAFFRYIDLWSDRRTWANEEPPVDGDTVVVPPGQSVLLDTNTPRLFVLLVQGELIFDNKDLALDASYILVQGGLMQIGTEDEPFLHKATITVHGDRWKSIALPRMGAKNLVVFDRYWSTGGAPKALGRLEIHGQPRQRTWTKVAASAARGTNVVETAEDVDFQPGETIIVTAGGRVGGYATTELRTVASRPGPRTIELTEPLQHDHESEIFDFEGTPIDMRCEVGIISRNIVVQGDDYSPRQLFGIHTMTAGGGSYRVENAEFRNCGQSFVMGRYCTHFHMAGFQAHSYVKSNSVHHSFQRSTTVHGTHHSLVKNNVAYFIRGHNFFVEDGIEMKNVIEGNLGAHTLRCFSCLKSDTKPATYWMAGPNNIWRHNVAAGSINDGYWFEPPGHPHGPSFTTTVCPVGEHLEEFFNNTAHSNGVHGLRIYPQWTPRLDPCDSSKGPYPVYLHNFTSFHNGQHGIFTKVSGDIHHVDAKLVENGGDEVFWTKLEQTVYKWDPHFKNLLAIASRSGQRSKHGIFGPQNEYFYVDGATFVNYATGVLAGCAKCGSHTDMKQGGYTFRWKDLRFVNSPNRAHWTVPYKQIFWDVDGSLTGIANGTVFPYYAFNAWPECEEQGVEYDNGLICDASVRVRRVAITNVEPRELDFKTAIITGRQNRHEDVPELEWGLKNVTKPGQLEFRPKEEYGWVVPLVTSHRYHFDFDSDIDFQGLRVRYGEYAIVDEGWTPASSPADATRGSLDVPGDWVALAFNFTDQRWNFEVKVNDVERPWLNALTVPTQAHDLGTGSMINNTQEWHVMANTQNTTVEGEAKYQFDVFPLQCPPDGCYVPPPPDWRTPVMWSNPLAWPSGNLPVAGQDIIINSTTYIIMDINPPKLGKVEVHGRLDFGDGSDKTLEAESLVIYGHFQIGESERRPYANKANIILHGSRNSPSVIVDNTLFLGNKVMVVVGTALLYGKPVDHTWVRLKTTAAAGSTTLELNQNPGWAVGSEIVIGPTEYDTDETETATIAAVSGATLTLSSPLQYSHFAGTVSVPDPASPGDNKDVLLRAAVGLLSRSIAIEGAVASSSDTYGAHVVVAEIPPSAHGGQSGQDRMRIGRMEAHYADFRYTGKGQSEHPSVLFKYQFSGEVPPPQNEEDPIPVNVVKGCAFAHTLNYAVVAQMARNMRLVDNVVHHAYRSAIDVDGASTNATITGNLVAGTYRSPDETEAWVTPIASFYIAAPVAELSNNVAAGSDDAGFVFRPDTCAESGVELGVGDTAPAAGGKAPGHGGGSANTHAVHNNEAVGCVIGGWVLPRTRTCVSVSHFTAWKSSHVGLFSIDQTANLVVQDSVVADNHIGMSFNFFRASRYNQVDLRRSIVIGSSSASTCDASVTCAAMNENDVTAASCNSVFGAGWRRVGVLLPQYLNRAKTCEIDMGLDTCRPPTRPERLCSLPWEKRYGLPSASNAYMNVTSVTFANFKADDCGKRSVAFSWNPSQPDWSPSTGFSRVAWSNTPKPARFWLGPTGSTRSECTTGCDGKNFIALQDLDGTLLEQSGATPGVRLPSGGGSILGHNGLLVQPSPHCVEEADWSAFACAALPFRGVVAESRDRDRGNRRLGPFRPTPVVPDGSDFENRTYGSVGPFDDSCAKRFHFGQFPFALMPGLRYDIRAAATLPDRLRFHFLSDDPEEVVVVEMFFIEAFRRELFVNGEKVEPLPGDDLPTLSHPRGANRFHPQHRKFYFVMRGGDPFATYDIVTTPRVQLTVRMDTSLQEFVSANFINNLALLLEIESSRIKVVNVRVGSVIADTEIEDEAPTQVDDAAATQQFDRLAQVAKNVETLANEGNLNVGYDLLNLEMAVPKPPAVSVVVGGDTDPNDPTVQASAANSSFGQGTSVTLGAGSSRPIRIGPLPEPESGLSTGALVGIIAGGCAVVAGGIIAGVVMAKKRKAKRNKRVSVTETNKAAITPPPGMQDGDATIQVGPRPARVKSWRMKADANDNFEYTNPKYSGQQPPK